MITYCNNNIQTQYLSNNHGGQDYWQLYIYLWFYVTFQHSLGHITMDSWKGRGNQYIQLLKVLYCKMLTNGKQLPAFPFVVGPGTEPRSQRWEATVQIKC